jgi:hypothetical protein
MKMRRQAQIHNVHVGIPDVIHLENRFGSKFPGQGTNTIPVTTIDILDPAVPVPGITLKVGPTHEAATE